jgi:Tfp pilus assembly protein PilF
MRLCLVRWRGRAALLAMLCAFAGAAAAGLDDGAKKDAAKPEEKNPDIEDAGKLLLQGKPDEALKKLETARNNNKDLPPAKLMLARLMMRVRDYQPRVHAVIEEAIKETPDHPVCFLDNANLALAEGRVTDCILNSERALQLAESGKNWTEKQKKDVTERAHANMASAYESRADWSAARAQLDALLKADATNPQYRARLAQAIFFMDPEKKESDARTELMQAKKNDKDNKLESPAVSLARFWARHGDNPKARERFIEAAKAEPKNAKVLVAYADFLMQQNDVNGAKMQIDEALKAPKTDDVEVEKFQGLIARAQKKYDEAEAIYRKLIDKNPDDAFSRTQLALVLVDQAAEAKQKLGVQYAKLNAEANQKAPEALSTFGYALCKTGNLGEGAQLIQAALNASNGQMTPDMAYMVAYCLKDKDPEAAKKILKEAATARGLFIYKQEADDLRTKLDSRTSSNK